MMTKLSNVIAVVAFAITVVESCDEVPLGMSNGEIPDSSITASDYSSYFYPYQARLNSGNYWRSNKPGAYIEVDLGITVTVTGTIIVGTLAAEYSVNAYQIKWLDENDVWVYLKEASGSIATLEGVVNGPAEDDVLATFPQPIRTRYIRLYPTAFSTNFLLSFELLGCEDPALEGEIRLFGGSSDSGRVEIMHDGAWGTVCDDDWDIAEAKVVCKQLGFRYASNAKRRSLYGRSQRGVVMSTVRCNGDEAQLKDCPFLCDAFQPSICNNYNEAGVVCINDTRLVDGAGYFQGRVETYRDNQWGTICDNGWDLEDAKVLCRRLGFSGAVEAVGAAYYGGGSGKIHYDGLACDGYERSLDECPRLDCWEESECDHSMDAGVTCE